MLQETRQHNELMVRPSSTIDHQFCIDGHMNIYGQFGDLWCAVRRLGKPGELVSRIDGYHTRRPADSGIDELQGPGGGRPWPPASSPARTAAGSDRSEHPRPARPTRRGPS